MMLILMRSGECQPLSVGGRDSDRQLNEAGIRECVSSAIFLSSVGIEPKAILASPFTRTKQSAEIISEHLPDNPEVIVAPYIMPGAGSEEILRSIKARTNCTDSDCVIAVCHEPDISNTVKELLKIPNAFIPAGNGTVIGMRLHCREGSMSANLAFIFSPEPGSPSV